MAVHGRKTRRLRGVLRPLLADLPHVLFFFLVLPLLLILLMIPSSWYEAEGYADLGLVDFAVGEADPRGQDGPYGRGVIYRATDGSGLSFREGGPLYPARSAAEAGRHIQRHVYISYQRPGGILRLLPLTTGRIFLPAGEDLREHLKAERRMRRAVCGAGFCYTAGYLAFVVRRRKGRGEKRGKR